MSCMLQGQNSCITTFSKWSANLNMSDNIANSVINNNSNNNNGIYHHISNSTSILIVDDEIDTLSLIVDTLSSQSTA